MMGSVRPRGVRRRSYVSAESNKEIVRRLGVEPWEGKMGVIDEVVSPGYVGHDPAQPTLQGPDGIKGFITAYLAGFPDGRIAIEEQLAEGDVVATRWTGRGTHTGELMGIPPRRQAGHCQRDNDLAPREWEGRRGMVELGHARDASAARRRP